MRRVAVLAILVSGLVIPVTAPVYADFGTASTGAGGTTINASAAVAGLFLGGRPADYADPCNKDGLPQNGTPGDDYSKQQPTIHIETDAITGDVPTARGGHWNLGVQLRKKVEYEGRTFYAGLSVVTCKWTNPDLDDDGVPDKPPIRPPWNGVGEYIGAYWYPIRPEPRVMIPAMLARAQRELGDPVLAWPNMNPQNNWLYVQLPMAYTLQPIGYVRVVATAGNELGSATAWIQATPTRIEVDAGGTSSSCSVGDAMTDHGADEAPPCSVVFEKVARDVPLTVTLTWTITSSVADAGLPETLTTTSTGTVDVAEVQALVEPQG